ncbi:methenyltetrahydromethanopterin cyclohydrolase [Moorella naiadis]|uniref:methenyltetrahydromethanopterin cyclohydrolase n=1 Tax=Moorella naiadis (nom. illeg.) TaxID=3093670 RepID=UPI003D9C9AA3
MLTLAVIDGKGLVSFGDFDLGSYRLPALNICYDAPQNLVATLAEPVQIKNWEVFGPALDPNKEASLLCLLDKRDAGSYQGSDVWESTNDILNNIKVLTKRHQYLLAVTPYPSLVGMILQASLALPRTLQVLITNGLDPGRVLWGWSSCPLPPLVDDLQLAIARLEKTLLYGLTISLWVRNDHDQLVALLNKTPVNGQVRLHNLTAAKTIVKGSIAGDQLRNLYSLQGGNVVG